MNDPGLSQKQLKEILDKVSLFKGLKKLNKKEKEAFDYYHIHRNKFNFKHVLFLYGICNGGNTFHDNFGNTWKELPTLLNEYHMPADEYKDARKPSIFQKSDMPPYSRKFVRDDDGDLKGEFELIIHRSGFRIDGDIEERVEYRETYNFGRTRDIERHYILDMRPHENTKYADLEQDMGFVHILEEKDLCTPEWTTKYFLENTGHRW